MRLRYWLATHDVRSVLLPSGNVQVFTDPHYSLFHLDDYRVASAVSGPSYIMVPR